MSVSGHILVVDDDDDIRDMMRLLLEGEGYSVVTAGNGVDAWQLLEAGPLPSLILLDLMMPSMDGERFLKTLRASRFGQVPVVLLSGHNGAKEKGLALHAEGVLAKPVELEDLLAMLVRLIPSAATHPAGDGSAAPVDGGDSLMP